MINNTSPGKWNRLLAKSIENQFIQEMIEGLNCSPFEAEAILEKVYAVYGYQFDSANVIKPGQIQLMAIDASVTPNTPLIKAKQTLVTLTMKAMPDDLDFRKINGVPALRQKRLLRMAEEAFQQGALLTLEDFADLFNCGVRSLNRDLEALRLRQTVPPLRSTIKDMGRAITHRRLIIDLWLQGFEYSDIAARSCHAIESVYNYVDKFKRSVTLFQNNFDLKTTAFVVKISFSLVREFHRLFQDMKPVAHRLEELQLIAKKNTSLMTNGVNPC